MATKESNPLIGKPTVTEEDNCQICRTSNQNGQSYEQFFNEDERKQLKKIADDNPDLVVMLPPVDGKYLPPKNSKATKARREQWHKKKTKNNIEGEYHHPHPIGAGGCPFHQDVIKKPTDQAGADKFEAMDQQVSNIVDNAINRARGG